MLIGNREFHTNEHVAVMGILNVTPDSFYDGGKYSRRDAALRRVGEMLAEGMELLDIGGESSRPGSTPVTEEEEIERVVPVIEAVKKEYDLPVSLDTCKAEVARAGIAAGADMINDTWGLKQDEDMGRVIAEANVACCLMHNRKKPVYEHLLKEVAADLSASADLALKAGIAKDKIILDAGIGFGKNREESLEVLNHLEELCLLGFPLLLGASRKSVIGEVLQLPVGERIEGTLVTTVLGVLKGVSFVRVHDVKENVRAIRMAEAILHR